MKVGNLTAISKEGVHFKGSLNTLKFSLKAFEFRRISEPGNGPDAPRWEAVVISAGGEFAIGLGWEKEISRGDQIGKTMFSITFDDPSMDRPIYIAAFPAAPGPQGEPGFDLVWSRPRRNAADPTGADEIPF